MKELHLICNAHLDPVWLWQWKEGAAEAISTFRIAADFCEKYDTFVFNHNESLLYEWVEEYEPQLFLRIKKLVEAGKWHIMGGWYLQPDCVMPSGESFISQIELGNKYFFEKFGTKTNTAVNFDPFGHTVGLVQILNKMGYKNYVFMRPIDFCQSNDFIWNGLNDSCVTAHNIYCGSYNSLKGKAMQKIKSGIEQYENDDVVAITWGIGNHGGGPSKEDLEEINEFISETPDVKISHSIFEDYFNALNNEELPSYNGSLEHTMVGCYTTMVRVKQKHRELENQISVAQKMLSCASLQYGMKYPENEIDDVRKTLAFCEFHDILPGSCIKTVEDDSLRSMSYALEKCDKMIAKAYFILAKGQKKAKDEEIPLMIYNPHSFSVEGDFEVEYMLQNQNWNDEEFTVCEVYDENGNRLKTQSEKPIATFNLDWVKKVCFHATLSPSSMNRFDFRLKVIKKEDQNCNVVNDIVIENNTMKVVIGHDSGLIKEYIKDGKVLVKNSGIIEVYSDNEDPWGMRVDRFADKKGEFVLLSDEEAQKFLGYPDEKCSNVRIVEDGEVRTKIQAIFKYSRSYAVIEYTVSKIDCDIDVHINLFSNDALVFYKYKLETQLDNCEFYGQVPFGSEKQYSDGRECTFQKWCSIKNNENMLSIINEGIYGGSFCENTMYLSLLRTPLYSAHPIEERRIAPHNRYVEHIDMGQRSFSFKITASNKPERKAIIFNEKPVCLSFFPDGSGEKKGVSIAVENEDVQLSLIKKDGDDYIFHLYNSADEKRKATLKIVGNIESEFEFSPYELKFIKLSEGKLIEF